MGWLFGSKKTPRVPLPEGQYDEKTLQFPKSSNSRTIIPEYQEEHEQNAPLHQASSPQPMRKNVKIIPTKLPAHHHYYVKVEIYEQILADMEGLKKDIGHLSEINHLLETSEFNEEADYDKIKRALKNAHDKLVSMDKTLFTARN